MKILKNKGFTLVEILLVVGFISLASIGIYTIYSKVQISNQANIEARNIDTIRSGIKSLYGGRSNYSGLSESVINKARITPDNMKTPLQDNKITSSFGGLVMIGVTSLGAGSYNGFSIVYYDVPSAVCSKLVTSSGIQFDKIFVESVLVKEYGSNEPIDVTKAIEGCNEKNNVTIVFASI